MRFCIHRGTWAELSAAIKGFLYRHCDLLVIYTVIVMGWPAYLRASDFTCQVNFQLSLTTENNGDGAEGRRKNGIIN